MAKLGVSLILCCFVVYSTRRFVVCLSMCHFVLVFFSPFSVAITSLGEERANLSAFLTFVRFVLVWILSVSSSSWGLGRAAVCDYGTPWTFLFLFFFIFFFIQNSFPYALLRSAECLVLNGIYDAPTISLT